MRRRLNGTLDDRAARRLANVLEVDVLLSTAAMLLGLLGRLHYLPDLASHFRIQVIVLLLLAGALLWPLGRRRWAIFSLTFGLLLLASQFRFLLPFGSEGDGRYRLLTINVLTDNEDHDLVVEYILKQQPDFILLQETNRHWIDTLDRRLSETWPHRKTLPRSDNFGIALYSKWPWSRCDVVEFSEPMPTPSISASFDLPGKETVHLIGTHALPPMSQRNWRARNELFSQIASDITQRLDSDRSIVAGDLNCTPFSLCFSHFLSQAQLKNSAQGHGLGITWLPVSIELLGLPIDHVLVGKGVRIAGHHVGPDVGSDHHPVVVDFD